MQRLEQPSALPELDTDTWEVVASKLSVQHMWSAFATSTSLREAVLRAIQTRTGLNAEQARVYAAVALCGRSTFLEGGAGVGKSHTLRVAVRGAKECLGRVDDPDCAAMVCFMGAVAVRGRPEPPSEYATSTIHAFLNVRDGVVAAGSSCVRMRDPPVDEEGEVVELNDDEQGVSRLVAYLGNREVEKLRKLDLLIVEEVSMVSAELFSLLDESLRCARGSNRPFGGCSVLACGDYFQLAPILSEAELARNGGRCFAFEAEAWRALAPMRLTTIVRQKDAAFAAVLNRMRTGRHTAADVAWFNANAGRCDSALPASFSERAAFNSNAKCDARNALMLARSQGQSFTLRPERYCRYLVHDGNVVTYRRVHDDQITDRVVYASTGRTEQVNIVKIGARVALKKNIYEHADGKRRLVAANGMLGRVEGVDLDANGEVETVSVLLDDTEETVEVPRVPYVRKQRWTLPAPHNSELRCAVQSVVKMHPLKASPVAGVARNTRPQEAAH